MAPPFTHKLGESAAPREYLNDTRTQVIVAAVECNHRDNERLKEYTPESFTFKDGSFIKAKGKKYMVSPVSAGIVTKNL